MATQPNPGESPANTQTGTRSHQNMNPPQEQEPIEKKHLADDTTGRQEPSANPKRAPEHEPGFEEKHQKEAQKEAHKRPASERSQADDSMAKIDADRDVDANKTQKANRTQTARRKHEVKRTKVRKHK